MTFADLHTGIWQLILIMFHKFARLFLQYIVHSFNYIMQMEIYEPEHTSISSFPAKILINACVSVLNDEPTLC